MVNQFSQKRWYVSGALTFFPQKDVETTSNQIWEKINIDLYFTLDTIYKLS